MLGEVALKTFNKNIKSSRNYNNASHIGCIEKRIKGILVDLKAFKNISCLKK